MIRADFLLGSDKDFQENRTIGKGTTAYVVKSRQVAKDRWVALKIFMKNGFEVPDAAMRERIALEIELLRRLPDDPNIVQIFGTAQVGAYPALILEYVDGNLQSRLARQRLTSAEVITLGGRMAAALVAAAQVGIVHEDIKPANILTDGNGTAKLSDFGLATVATHARHDYAAGTPLYMAPEKLYGWAAGDSASDIYSLAATLYEALAGAPPFTGDTEKELAAQVLAAAPPPLCPLLLCNGHHQPLCEIITRSLAKDARERPTPLELLALLKNCEEEV